MTVRVPPQRVPTLTEVIEGIALQAVPLAAQAAVVPLPADAAGAVAALPTDGELTARVLADVQRQVEVMLEHRLREALMPALLRATDALVLEVRTELALTLNDIVSRAVVQEMARQRAR